MSTGHSPTIPPPSSPPLERALRGIRLRRQADDGDEAPQHDRALEAPDAANAPALSEASQRREERQQEVDALIDDLPDENEAPAATPIVEPVPIRNPLPTAPVPATSVVPQGWILLPDSLSLGMRLVMSAALVIVRRLIGDDGAEMVELAFFRDGVWLRREVPREQVATPQKIVSLARTGLPVTALNARNVVAYLADYERDNIGSIPTVRRTRRAGWHTVNGQDVFVLGDRVIAAQDPSADPENFQERQVGISFRASGDGTAQIAAGLATAGTLANWLETMAFIGPYPRARFAFYAALVPALLNVLNSPNFVVDFCGPTSRGKTTVLRIAAAVWGNPDEAANSSLMLNWDSTPAYRLGVAAAMTDLPLIIDETRLAGSKDEVVQTIYAIANGRTRGRTGQNSSTSGLSTVLITSGEVPIVTLTKKGGARARCFSLWGSPFGRTTAETAGIVRQLNNGLLANYGHAGVAFVEFLVNYRNIWDTWREDYRRRVEAFERRANGDPVISRMAAALAAISLAASLAHEAMELPWPHEDVVEVLSNELTAEGPDADSAMAALEHVVDWARGHQNQFFGTERTRRTQPSGGWAGRWDVDGEWIGFRPEILNRVLTAGGYEIEAVMRNWRERRWVLLDQSSGKARHRTRIEREPSWVVAIRMEAIREIEGVENE